MFDDIYRTRARMAAALQVVHGDQTADHGVEDAFEYLVALLVQNGGSGQQMADIAHEQQRASVQRLRVALEIRIGAVLEIGRATYELQTLMRNSYAVCGLKKKREKQKHE